MREFGIASIVLLLALNSFSAAEQHTGDLDTHRHKVDINDRHPVHESLRLLTYNTFLRPPPVSWGDRNTCRATHIAQRLATEPLPRDIVVLDETFDHQAVSKLSDIVAKRFPYRLLSLPTAQGFRTNGGVSVLSRHPIEEWSAHRFHRCSGEFNDCLATKGFVWALIRVSRHLKVNLLATHLNSGSDPNAKEVRRSQLEQIHDFFASHPSFRRWPTLLMGDLNLNGLRWAPRNPRSGKATEYASIMGLLGNSCVQCHSALCRATCRPFPVDALRKLSGPWTFDARGTRPINTYNCTAQTMQPCLSPNDDTHWRERMRIDYVMHFGPPRLAPDLDVHVVQAHTVPLRNDACGTTYLSDHQAVAATVHIGRDADLNASLNPSSAR